MRVPTVVDGRLRGTAAELTVDSPAWFAWLGGDDARSFSFRAPAGSYTARKERRQRGGAYWVAYRTAAGRQHKLYLGKGEELTGARLTEAAAALAVRVSGFPLLTTKLFAPKPHPGLIARPRLLDRLDAGLTTARCTLLSAPAGSGKTSLLASWLAHLDRPAGWLTLDENDRNAGQVLRYLIAALRAVVPDCGGTALSRLDAARTPPAEAVVTGIVNDLAALTTPGLLVLDDYHLVRSPDIHAAITFLLERLPPALHLVIAGREDPPLPLPRLRARGQLAEMRAPELAFTRAEASALLTGAGHGGPLGGHLGGHLGEEQVAALVERTEGWAAGLRLAGLALLDRTDPAAFVAAFAGRHRLVADYLTTEVLDRQPAPVRRFLLATAVLDRMCAPLCDALLDTSDARDLLSQIERANLFLVPLDDEGIWYRYHHLFADALRARAGRDQTAPHRRAAAWFGRAGLLPEAIGHALAGGAVAEAAEWIAELAPSLFATMAIHPPLAEWLAALPEEVLLARPRLCLARAWLLIHRVELEEAVRWVEAAAGPAVAADAGAVAATRAYLATVAPDVAPDAARELASRALRDLRAEDEAYRNVAAMSLGQAMLALGRLDEAEGAFADAARMARRAGLAQGSLTATTQQINVLRLRGAHRAALTAARSALARGGDQMVGRLRTVLADLLIDEGDLAAAWPPAIDGMAAPREFGDAPPLVVLGALPVVRLHLAERDPGAAEAVLDEVRPLVKGGPYTMVTRLLEAAEARVLLARGEIDEALDWATGVAWPGPVEPRALADMLRFGAPGVEAAAVTPARILVAAGRGGRHLEIARDLAARHRLGWLRRQLASLRGPRAEPLAEPITEREREVLRLVAAGCSTAEIAAGLHVEASTVKTHLIHLYRKLGAHSRTAAVARARSLALLD
ncbi:LuxR C-terminal-related transcriptional regulator [Actinoplanes sp. CA-030573]|uniref:LuxR C-terminal-related transcriptional regulator n=1 Tax=Actinoplanes sp. CA-030573 TaxID=3239898 RepID=UPI003D8B0948